ncbi:hypothetical protein [Nocardiopsis dassonvillei]
MIAILLIILAVALTVGVPVLVVAATGGLVLMTRTNRERGES